MPPRLPSLHGSLETFALGGASSDAPPNSREAFALAHRLGTDGIECTVRITADGVLVLDETGSIGSRLRRRPISSVRASDLPATVVPLRELLHDLGDRSLALDVPDDDVFAAVLALVRTSDDGLEQRLWLCSTQIESLMSWRESTSAHLVNVARLSTLGRSPEQWMALVSQRSIDGVRLDHNEWSAGLVALAHRFGRYALARGAVHEREMAGVIDIGIDGLSSRHADRLVAVAALYYPGRRTTEEPPTEPPFPAPGPQGPDPGDRTA